MNFIDARVVAREDLAPGYFILRLGGCEALAEHGAAQLYNRSTPGDVSVEHIIRVDKGHEVRAEVALLGTVLDVTHCVFFHIGGRLG